jgi:hypothetical protein
MSGVGLLHAPFWPPTRPALLLFDENGKLRACLGIGQASTPDGRTITYPESSLRLYKPDGKVL